MTLKVISTLTLWFITLFLRAQFSEYAVKTFHSADGDTLLYRELAPQQIEQDKKYPLVLFLHGAGERGNDNISQLTHGSMMFTNPVNREKYPCYAVFPQCPSDEYWPSPKRPDNFHGKNPLPLNAPMSKPLTLTKELLDKLTHEYQIDPQRIYIIGLSMGGMGTFDMVCRFPDYFAAVVPICGGINTERLSGLKTQTNFRIFHGDADSVVPVRFSREAYLKLSAEGIDVEYIEFPGIDHGSWNPAFNLPDFMSWIFQQTK